MKNFIWFRNDLRLFDNKVLQRAFDLKEQGIPLFILDPKLIDNPNTPPLRLSFLAQSLLELQEECEKLGTTFLVIKSDPIKFWQKVSNQEEIHVLFSKDYVTYATKRDNEVRKIVTNNGGSVESIKNLVIFDDEDEILTKTKEPVKVFTRFKEQWLLKLREQIQILVLNYEAKQIFCPIEKVLEFEKEIQSLGFDSFSQEDLQRWTQEHPYFPGGEKAGRERWKEFKKKRLFDYKNLRNELSIAGTSKLSPYYKWGSLSIFEAARDCVKILGKDFYNFRKHAAGPNAGVETYLSELIWREFYKYINAYFPYQEKENYSSKYNAIEWKFEEEKFKAWKEGRTGYPIVDACMRQLNQESWLHNRGRMIVGSFLCKDLHIDWKEGDRYFQQKLIDWDRTSNTGGWQWVAGTGTDAAPYFRIFNPMEQGKRFDLDGEYVKKYIPELKDIPVKYIHEPWKMNTEEQQKYNCILGKDYPERIVDHSKAREETLRMYKVEANNV